jgi:hypothetical protein
MNNFIKQLIEEEFASKSRQKYFYDQASKGDKKVKKCSKCAKEQSSKTDFNKLPEKVEKEVDEIVDVKGNIKRGETPITHKKNSILSKKRTDKVVKTGTGAMGIYGIGISGAQGGQAALRYLGEIEMDSALGYEDTLGSDATYKEAMNHFTKNLGLPEDEAKERLSAMGYIPNEEDLVRLIENPKDYIRNYVESVLVDKTKNSEIMDKKEIKINPLILKQIESLKNSLSKNNIPVEKIINLLKK